MHYNFEYDIFDCDLIIYDKMNRNYSDSDMCKNAFYQYNMYEEIRTIKAITNDGRWHDILKYFDRYHGFD